MFLSLHPYIMGRLVGLRCTPSLVEDVNNALAADCGALPPEEVESYAAASEIYGNARMLLACVEDRALLDAVVGGCGGADMEEVLAPLKNVRPSKGGPGWSLEVRDAERVHGVVDLSKISNKAAA